jgi:hypothetical protein
MRFARVMMPVRSEGPMCVMTAFRSEIGLNDKPISSLSLSDTTTSLYRGRPSAPTPQICDLRPDPSHPITTSQLNKGR